MQTCLTLYLNDGNLFQSVFTSMPEENMLVVWGFSGAGNV